MHARDLKSGSSLDPQGSMMPVDPVATRSNNKPEPTMASNDPTPDPPAKQKRVMTTAEIIKANDILREHVELLGDGMCEYHEGWSDATVASVMGAGLTPQHIQTVRQKMFGKLRQSPRSVTVDINIVKRLENLERVVEVLSSKHNALQDQVNDLAAVVRFVMGELGIKREDFGS